jgi:hypothetical protein
VYVCISDNNASLDLTAGELYSPFDKEHVPSGDKNSLLNDKSLDLYSPFDYDSLTANSLLTSFDSDHLCVADTDYSHIEMDVESASNHSLEQLCDKNSLLNDKSLDLYSPFDYDCLTANSLVTPCDSDHLCAADADYSHTEMDVESASYHSLEQLCDKEATDADHVTSFDRKPIAFTLKSKRSKLPSKPYDVKPPPKMLVSSPSSSVLDQQPGEKQVCKLEQHVEETDWSGKCINQSVWSTGCWSRWQSHSSNCLCHQCRL